MLTRWVSQKLLIQYDDVSTARVKGNVGLGLCWRGLGGAYTFIVHADSAYDASQAGNTVVILAARWENPWLWVTEPRTTWARIRPANNHENCWISGYKTLPGRKNHGYRLWGIPKAKYRTVLWPITSGSQDIPTDNWTILQFLMLIGLLRFGYLKPFRSR